MSDIIDKLEEYQDYLFETNDIIKRGIDFIKGFVGDITERVRK